MSSFGGITPTSSIACVAIDFGTSCSGFSLLFKGQPLKSAKTKRWPPHETVKVPTCILINRVTCQYMEFGHDARKAYVEMLDKKKEKIENEKLWDGINQNKLLTLMKKVRLDDEEEGLLFQKFKMQLYDESEQKGDKFVIPKELTAQCGDIMRSSVVFRESLRYMKDKSLKLINGTMSGSEITSDQIRWIVTIPGMGSVQAKAFMRRAAESAGLGTVENVEFALEPEAASFYVRQEIPELKSLGVGQKYLLVDAGGGTVDFACHQKEHNGVRETHSATGSPCGSTYLDKGFYSVMNEIFDSFNSFSTACPGSALHLEENWIDAKHKVKDFENKIFIGIPTGMQEYYHGPRRVRSKCKKYKDGKAVSFREGFIGLSTDVVTEILMPVFKKIETHIEGLLRSPEVRGTQYLVLVGGFGNSNVLKTHLEQSFPDMKVVRPALPEEAVLLGATQYSRNETAILSRKMQLTYGVVCSRPFENTDDISKRYVDEDGELRCNNCFSIYTTREESVKINDTIKQTFYPGLSTTTVQPITFYSSTSKNPKYVDESGCVSVGSINLPVPEGKNKYEKHIDVEFKFGGTEIVATTKVRGFGEAKLFTIQVDDL